MKKGAWVALSVVVDAALINGGIVLSFLMRYGGKLPSYNFDPYLRMAVWITLIQLAFLFVLGCYDPQRMSDRWNIFASVVQAVSFGLIVVIVLTFVLRSFSFPRLIFVITWFVQVALLALWRLFELEYLSPQFENIPVLVVGMGDTARLLVEEIDKHHRFGYRLEGVVGRSPREAAESFDGVEVLGDVTDIPGIVADRGIKYVVITIPIRERQLVEDLIKVRSARIRVDVVPELYEIMVGRIDEVGIGDIPLVSLVKLPQPGYLKVVKTALDILLALILILAILPFWIMVALAIKLTSRGPVFYRQARVGKDGVEYMMFKFRTMVRGAEEDTGPVLARYEDERVTRVGSFLRRSHLDEAAQLLNVIAGQMSFVGPRPERPEFVRRFNEEILGYSERFAVRPGLTGLAQISGNYATNTKNKLKFDLLYIQNQSILLDVKIILKTITAMFTSRGSQA
ncbi:MAG: exopolysaccharide biosynthesis polyprenyl glycosylphosphotransferase [Actinomycetota bacterium]|nr:exopolysaccharide biosynthesis polyprenyl glycosylphosphotransferase [Actinomycetota bacterium]